MRIFVLSLASLVCFFSLEGALMAEEAAVSKENPVSAVKNLPDLPAAEPNIPQRQINSNQDSLEEMTPELSLEDIPKLKKKKLSKEEQVEKEDEAKNWLLQGVEEQEKFQAARDKFGKIDEEKEVNDKLSLEKSSSWLLQAINTQKKLQEEQQKEKNKNNTDENQKSEETLFGLGKNISEKENFLGSAADETQNSFQKDSINSGHNNPFAQMSPFSHYTTAGIGEVAGPKTDALDSTFPDAAGNSIHEESIKNLSGSDWQDSSYTSSQGQNSFGNSIDIDSSKTLNAPVISNNNNNAFSPSLPEISSQPLAAPQPVKLEDVYTSNLGHSFTQPVSTPSYNYSSTPAAATDSNSSTAKKGKISDPNDFLSH